MCSCVLSRSPEEGGGLETGSPSNGHLVYGSHANLNSAEGLGKKQEREQKSATQQAGEKGEAISQFELNYGSKSAGGSSWIVPRRKN